MGQKCYWTENPFKKIYNLSTLLCRNADDNGKDQSDKDVRSHFVEIQASH